jgi:hypothetical protein
VTVEEVATLAKGFGWSYETLMAMSGAERRLWLAAVERVQAVPGRSASSAGLPPAAPPPASAPAAPRMSTDAERRARLLELHEELNHRERRR